MVHPLLGQNSIVELPNVYLGLVGTIFAVFDEQTQDSGNVSYGVEVDGQRYFVKTAGSPDDPKPFLTYPQRVTLLHRAQKLAQSCNHTALPRLRNVIGSPHGPLLVYDWVTGELLHAHAEHHDDPASAHQRFRRLPVEQIAMMLDTLFDLHRRLAELGWVAVDFYDGALIYDFDGQRLYVVDLDLYHEGPFVNEMGRMFGSSRFMAPEEFELGAWIDQRTMVFTMGRTISNFLSDGSLEREPFRGDDLLFMVMKRACCAHPAARFQSMAAFCIAWNAARRG